MTVQIYGNAENDWTVKQFTSAKLKLMDYGSSSIVKFSTIQGVDQLASKIYKEENESFADIPTEFLNGGYSGDLSFNLVNGSEVYNGTIKVVPAKPEKSYSEYNSLPSWLRENYNAKTRIVIDYYSSSLDLDGFATEIDLSRLNTTGRTNLSYLFSGLESLKSIDVSDIDTSSATTITYMFNACSKLTTINLSTFDTRNVTDMSRLFLYCSGLTSLDVSPLNTSEVTTLKEMFAYCICLTSLDLSSWDTSKVTDMSGMFYNGFTNTSKLKEINLKNFNTSKVTDFHSMFGNCDSLETLDLSSFDTTEATDMREMFADCASLATIEFGNFNTAKVTNMSGMFNNCNSLQSIDLSTFNTVSVTNMSIMFQNCYALTSLDLSSFNTANVTGMSSMFNNCNALTSITFGTDWASNIAITELDYRTILLNHDSAVDLFNKLATRTNSPVLKLNYTTYSGTSSEEKSIASSKGWTVKTTGTDGSEIAYVPAT